MIRRPFYESGSQKLVALNTAARTEPIQKNLVCISRDLPVETAYATFTIQSVLVSPAGQVIVILPAPVHGQQLSAIMTEISTWTYDILNEMSANYFYTQCGQAFNVIDIMARLGHLTFSGEGKLIKGVKQGFQNGDFLLFASS